MSPLRVIVFAKQTAKGTFEIDHITSPVAGLEEFVGKSYPDQVAVQDAFVPLFRKWLAGQAFGGELIVLYYDRPVAAASAVAIPEPDFRKAGVFSILQSPSEESSDDDG